MLVFGSIKPSKDTVYYHVTHWKAGSQWLRRVFAYAFRSAMVEPDLNFAHVRERPPQPGHIIPCCYITAEEFRTVATANSRRLVVIRDLRDTLVSGYFSIRHSHPSNTTVDNLRSTLAGLNVEEGLLFLMEHWLRFAATIQRSWLAQGEPVIRLEQFMSDPAVTLHRAFTQQWGLRLTMRQAERLARRQSYEHRSGGRQPGEELIGAHYRKGIHGDWKNHFTPRVVEHFKKLHSDLLMQSGYETSDDWDLPPKAAYEPIDQSRAESLRH